MKSLILLFAFCIQSVGLAGIRVGTGGNVILCPDRAISLDLYEGEFQYMFQYHRQPGTWKELVSKKMQNIAGLRSPKVETFLQWLSEFENESKFVAADLGTVDDSFQIILPKNCQLVQAAIQQFKPLPNQKRYLISSTVWNQLSDWDRAALVTHELSYRYLQQTNSLNARYFTGLLFSDDIENLSPEQLQTKMNDLGF